MVRARHARTPFSTTDNTNGMVHSSYIELSASALHSNINFIRGYIGANTTLYTVLKGNAYGHGIEQMVPLLLDVEVRHFAVFDANEAWRIQQVAAEACDIVIMGFIDNSDIRWAIEHNVQIYVFGYERLERIIAGARSLGRQARVHIEVETGFNRTGFTIEELPHVLDLIRRHSNSLYFEGLCTHYAGAESLANYQRIVGQMEVFHKAMAITQRIGTAPQHYHSACSAATIMYPSTSRDMVRIGILQYGFWPSEETHGHYLHNNPGDLNPLRRVIAWKSKVMAVKSIEVGEYVGYGSTFMASMPTTIAIVPVGYGYGYSRSLSNLGRVLIRGTRLPVIGLVNMNMLVVNTNEAPNVQEGDEVVLIGNQEEHSITVASFSELSNQLNYELLTRLPAHIPRRVVE